MSMEIVWWSLCGARDDSPSWNLGRAKRSDTIRVDGTSPRGRGQEDVKKFNREWRCFRVQYKVKYKAEKLSGMPS